MHSAMDTRWTIQVVLLSVVVYSLAQNFQPQSNGFQPQSNGFQPQSNGFQSQAGGFQSQRGPQGLTEEQREAIRAQDDFRKSVAEANRASVLKPKRPPGPEQLARTPQQTAQVQASPVPSQGFQGAPQPQAPRSQAPVRQQQPRPAVRQQQPRQPARPPAQAFEQQPLNRQQFDQPTAQQVNQQFFDQPPQPQQFERPVEPAPAPVPVRRPQTQPILRQQTQETQQTPNSQFDSELFRQQAENARYSFAAAVTDTINDQEHVREETRDGLNLRGLYSYSDGYYKRTVHYEADENGYRVTKEEVDAIGDGPKGDPNGRAEVSANVEGNNLQYTITAADIVARSPHLQPTTADISARAPHLQAQREQAFALT